MNVLIVGATGTIGRCLVERALDDGHRVTALARDPSALVLDHPHLTRLAGNVLDRDAVADAVQGHDAVLIALGAGRKGQVRSLGTGHVIAGMRRHGVRRLVCLSTLGAGDSHPLLTFFWRRIMFGLLLRQAFADHQAQETLVMDSGLDWTVVRPGAFTDGPATGRYRQGFPATARDLRLKISRADVAGFMARQLTDNTYLHRTPALSY